MKTCIGIDFGTTKTLVSRFDERRGEPRTIRLGRGRDFIPTSVYAEENGTFLYGEDADDQSIVDAAAYAYPFKLELGSSKCKLVCRAGQEWKKMTAQDLTRVFLEYVRNECVAQSYDCRRAVITRPVNFSPTQIAQLEEAAHAAGIEEVELITEPQAAGYAYCMERPDEEWQNALVVDWGGGTLDMALVSKHGDEVDAHDRYRDGMNCGGEDFDGILLQFVYDSLKRDGFGEQVAGDFQDLGWLYKTRKQVRRAKEALSRTASFSLRLSPPYTAPIPISRKDFEGGIMCHVDKAAQMAKKLIASIREQALKPSTILLVGGSSRIPAVVRILERETGLPCRTWDQSGEAVSLGAAIIAYRTWGIGGSSVPSNGLEDTVMRYRRAAEQGDAEAQFTLGICYFNGEGGTQDVMEAVYWYRKAAEQGHAEAQFNLGYCYASSQGVRLDDTEAVKWYRKAAEQGHARAQNNLGYCYVTGRGIAQNDMEAVKWYRKAAEQGHARAQNNLGYCYDTGRGVAQNDMEAVKWYRKAAEQGHAEAQCNLGRCCANGRGVAQDFREAAYWYRKAAEQGHAEAQCNLGRCYANGRGVAQNDMEAVKWYRKAAGQGHARAQNNLGYCYDTGRGVAQNDTEAVKWYRKAAEQGNAIAQCNLGRCCANGCGVAQDFMEAVYWYRKAAEQGHAEAQCNLGRCCATGRGVAQNDMEAAKWYRKAAEQGHAEAQCNLGFHYENGLGVTQSNTEAANWYLKAAEQGHARAQNKLRELQKPESPPKSDSGGGIFRGIMSALFIIIAIVRIITYILRKCN